VFSNTFLLEVDFFLVEIDFDIFFVEISFEIWEDLGGLGGIGGIWEQKLPCLIFPG